MFGFNSNKSQWEKIASQCDDYYFKEAIESLFIPFKVSLKKFAINMNCMEIGNSYSYEYSSPSTPHLGDWCMMPQWERPLGYAEWFYAAFPDVASWVMTAPGRKAVEAALAGIPDDEYSGSNCRLRIPILKRVVQAFVNNSRFPLETSN